MSRRGYDAEGFRFQATPQPEPQATPSPLPFSFFYRNRSILKAVLVTIGFHLKTGVTTINESLDSSMAPRMI